MAPKVEVTDELLQQAWQQRRRPGWPATFDACMADDMVRRVLRAEAVRLALALRRSTAMQALVPPLPVHRQPITPAPTLRAPAPRDLKRAAAGDASDD